MSGCQNLFVYHPTTDSEDSLLEVARRKGLQPWPNAGKGRMGWHAPSPSPTEAHAPPPAAGTPADQHNRLIVFHGNGGQAVDRDHYVRGFQGPQAHGQWEVYILEYPGYGSRAGKPSEKALLDAAREAVDYLIAEAPESPLYVLGTSLGTGVASQIAAAYPQQIPAVLLITPFTTLEDAAAARFPRFLVRLVLKDRYDSQDALANYDGRLAVLLAGKDEVVPTQLGQELFDGYDGPKRLWVQPEAGHNSLDYDPNSDFWAELNRFFLGEA